MIRLKLWAAGMAAAVAALMSIWFGGRMSGKAAARAAIAENRAKAVRAANDITNEVEALDRETLKNRAKTWMRN